MIAYAITDPTTLNFDNLSIDLKRFAKKADMILYRDKYEPNYSSNAKKFIAEAKKHKFDKVLLHGDIDLAFTLRADGVHLTSSQFDIIKKSKLFGLFTVISTHTLAEVKEAEKLGADMITFSPIFKTPNKGEPKGLDVLKEIVSRVNIPVIALGGVISDEQIEESKESGAKGFASIRYFS
jgi:thiamine-phosphate pyrophosphorylase